MLPITRYYGFHSCSHPGRASAPLPYIAVHCHIYLGALLLPSPPLWLCQLLLPRTVVWVCSGSQKESLWGFPCLFHATRLPLPWRSPPLICVFFVLVLRGLSCESRLYTWTALYVCAPVLLLLAGAYLPHRPVLRCVPVFAHYMIIACRYFYVFLSFLFLFLPAFSKMAVGI